MFIKSDIKNLNKQLELIANADTNARLTTETFDRDITELCNNINAVLDKQRSAVIETEKSGAEFKRAITNISHDLRTPLTSAIGYAQMLRDSGLPPDKRKEYLGVIERRLKSLSALMSNLFEYTQIVEGRTVFNIEKVNVCNVLRDVITQFYDDFSAKNFDVMIDIPDTPVCADCDSAAFARAAQNLIRNALEHGYGRFELSVSTDIVVFRNRVKDISALDVGRIFDRFYTSDFSRTNGNAGLGLAIVKELVEGMGLKISTAKEGDTLSLMLGLQVCAYS